MIVKHEKELTIPLEEKGLLPKETTKKIFTNIYNGYRNRFNLELICAYYSNNFNIMYEYMIMYKGRNTENTGDIILFDIPPRGSSRSVAGYRYYYRQGKKEDFFKFGIDNMVIIGAEYLTEFLQSKMLLSTKKEDENYWKSKEHIEDVMIALADFGLTYNIRIPQMGS